MKTYFSLQHPSLESSLRTALGPGFQFSGPAESTLRALAGGRPARPVDPVRR